VDDSEYLAACILNGGIPHEDILLAASGPLASRILAGGLAFGRRLICSQFVSAYCPIATKVAESGILLAHSLYLDLLGGFKGPSLRPQPKVYLDDIVSSGDNQIFVMGFGGLGDAYSPRAP
jgi:hypothetical protein